MSPLVAEQEQPVLTWRSRSEETAILTLLQIILIPFPVIFVRRVQRSAHGERVAVSDRGMVSFVQLHYHSWFNQMNVSCLLRLLREDVRTWLDMATSLYAALQEAVRASKNVSSGRKKLLVAAAKNGIDRVVKLNADVKDRYPRFIQSDVALPDTTHCLYIEVYICMCDVHKGLGLVFPHDWMLCTARHGSK